MQLLCEFKNMYVCKTESAFPKYCHMFDLENFQIILNFKINRIRNRKSKRNSKYDNRVASAIHILFQILFK